MNLLIILSSLIQTTLTITSPDFQEGKLIPEKFTCDGENISPAITITSIPKEAVSMALIMDDPDAPSGTFDHWIAWNIPASTTSLLEGATVPNQGKNHYGLARYRGPCPPKGKPHRYFIKVYALDQMIGIPDGATKEQLEDAMEGHILSKGELVGTYQRE